MKRIILLTAILAAGLCPTLAQAPGGTYYKSANGLKGEALKTKLSTIISQKSHSPSYDELLELYKKTDTRADGCVRDWYSNTTSFTHVEDKAGSYQKEGDVYNREHSVPQSWGAPKADIVHVIPTDGYVNNRRSNYPYGEVGTVKYQSNNGYSKMGTSKTPGYSGNVFEPNDEVKGDIARIYFYMATCYESTAYNWGHEVFTGNRYQPMAQWVFDMMLRWSLLDPVDDVERARNEAIARSDVQGNRNPFVDYPGLEDYIWGSKKDVAFSYDGYEGGTVVVADRTAQPQFSPDGGTFADRVEVTISCETPGAAIYYTTNGAEASVNSHRYTAPIVLTQTTTLRAIAVKEGLEVSYQSMAHFVVEQTTKPDEPATTEAVDIALNNALFGTQFDGALTKAQMAAFNGTQGAFTVVYDIAGGQNMFLNNAQLRLYPGNTLTLSVADDEIVEAEFTVVLNKNGKTMQATTGTVTDFTWRGQASSVVFTVNSGSGHLQLSNVRVKTKGTATAISSAPAAGEQASFHTLSGTRVSGSSLRPGVYIRNGKKILVKGGFY